MASIWDGDRTTKWRRITDDVAIASAIFSEDNVPRDRDGKPRLEGAKTMSRLVPSFLNLWKRLKYLSDAYEIISSYFSMAIYHTYISISRYTVTLYICTYMYSKHNIGIARLQFSEQLEWEYMELNRIG